MRLLLLLIAPLLLASPAQAGQRATYLDPDGKKLTIEIADDGNAVVRPEGEDSYGILRDGHFYMVGKENGVVHVARMQDMAAAFDQVLPPIFKDLFDMAAKEEPRPKLRIEPAGEQKVAGHPGQAYRVYGLFGDENADKPSTMVLSREESLQPASKAMEQFLISSIVAMTPLIGQTAGEMVADLQALFSHGAPIDMDGRFKLQSIETVAIPASAAALPAEPDTIAQIVASMKTSSPEAK